MNRAVKWILEDLTLEEVGMVLLLVVKCQLPGFKKYKEYYFDKDEIPDPLPLLKYGLRVFYIFKSNYQKSTLRKLKIPQDPYRIITFPKFTGRFSYDSKLNKYQPVFTETKGTEIIKEYWDKVEQRRIKQAWNEADKYLQGENDIPPILAQESE